ncbi:MAG: hypothetical protein QXN55_08590 [Candidatus Nitrosotenuis sp.]
MRIITGERIASGMGANNKDLNAAKIASNGGIKDSQDKVKAESTQNRSRVMPNNKNATQNKKPYQSLNLSPKYDQFDPTLT